MTNQLPIPGSQLWYPIICTTNSQLIKTYLFQALREFGKSYVISSNLNLSFSQIPSDTQIVANHHSPHTPHSINLPADKCNRILDYIWMYDYLNNYSFSALKYTSKCPKHKHFKHDQPANGPLSTFSLENSDDTKMLKTSSYSGNYNNHWLTGKLFKAPRKIFRSSLSG